MKLPLLINKVRFALLFSQFQSEDFRFHLLSNEISILHIGFLLALTLFDRFANFGLIIAIIICRFRFILGIEFIVIINY